MKRYDKNDEKGRFKWNPMKTYSKEKLERLIAKGEAMWTENSKYPVYKKYLDESSGAPLDNNWHDIAGIGTFASERTGFVTQKPAKLVERCIKLSNSELTLDYFGGSGTTAHAVINLNRADKGRRKYALIEMDEHFDQILQKVVYSPDWKDGKPKRHDGGISHCFKYLRLESYEDTLNNLTLEDRSADTLGLPANVQEEYLIRYMLDVETRDSLVSLQRFEDPWGCTLKVYDRESGEARPQAVDLVETFNYLLGLRVRELKVKDGFLAIEGENPSGETVLVIWRKLSGDSDWPTTDNAALKTFLLETRRTNPANTEYAAIYINGDSTLEDPHKKILLTEQVFHDLMFADVD